MGTKLCLIAQNISQKNVYTKLKRVFSPSTSFSSANSYSIHCSTLITVDQLVANVPNILSLTPPHEKKKQLQEGEEAMQKYRFSHFSYHYNFDICDIKHVLDKHLQLMLT
jgi:hypothetical protein